MKQVLLSNKNFNSTVTRAVSVLERGGPIVYPTDTVYGLGVKWGSDLGRIFAIKRSDPNKPLSWAVSSVEMIENDKKVGGLSVNRMSA